MQLKDGALFRQQAFVDGAWTGADDGATIDVTNPATGQVLGSVPKMGSAPRDCRRPHFLGGLEHDDQGNDQVGTYIYPRFERITRQVGHSAPAG